MFRNLALVACAPLVLCSQTLNMSHDLVVKGIASTDLLPNSSSLDARPLFEAAVAYAAQNGIQTVTADPGAYYFLTLRNSNRRGAGHSHDRWTNGERGDGECEVATEAKSDRRCDS